MLKDNCIFSSISIVMFLFLYAQRSAGLTKPVVWFLFYLLVFGSCSETAYSINFQFVHETDFYLMIQINSWWFDFISYVRY